jgi:GTP-binding protein
MSLRNIAIIAHVDHGKTTLVDQLLAQSGVFRANEATVERAMDSNDQERERGITILAKATSVLWKGAAGETRINIIDTPGHADFGGEVERILGMVDGCLLLVDAEEGVMPQTKFVLGKALKLGLKPIVVLNKADRPHAQPDRVLNDAFDLFAAIGATDEQLDFPHLYASGKQGWAVKDLEKDEKKDLAPLFDLIVEHVAPPAAEARAGEPFRLLSVLIESDPFLGRILTGRVEAGRATPGMAIKALAPDGQEVEKGRVTKILAFRGLKRQPIDAAEAGDIVAVAGLSKATVADTLCAPEVTEALPAQPIDPPTIAITVAVNDSPLAGREGDKVQSRVIRDRLLKEAEANVAIRVTETAEKDAYEVAGRGELQLGVLIETMRREGFEVSISRPRVVFQQGENGERLEPIEDVVIDVDDDFTGVVIEKLSARKAELKDMGPSGAGKTRIALQAPSRSLIGYQGEFLTDTRGSGVLNRVFSHYEPYKGAIEGRRNGVLVSNSDGETAAYALWNLEERGVMFVGGGEKTYQGMIIGENSRSDDLDVNPMKAKQLTNVRASGKDEAMRLTPPRRPTLEQAIAYIEEDELVEVTPKSIRLRKKVLNPSFRKKRVRED